MVCPAEMNYVQDMALLKESRQFECRGSAEDSIDVHRWRRDYRRWLAMLPEVFFASIVALSICSAAAQQRLSDVNVGVEKHLHVR
jgi:hypothetical protein